MRILTLAFVLAATGCANVKKTTTQQVAITDSAVRVVTDSAAKSIAVQKNKTLQVSDITFRILYANGDSTSRVVPRTAIVRTAAPRVLAGEPVDNEIALAIAAFNPDHSQIVSIDGHIGDVREVEDYSNKLDSQGVRTAQSKEVTHTDATIQTKESKWTWPAWLTILCIAVLIGAIVYLLSKFKLFGL